MDAGWRASGLCNDARRRVEHLDSTRLRRSAGPTHQFQNRPHFQLRLVARWEAAGVGARLVVERCGAHSEFQIAFATRSKSDREIQPRRNEEHEDFLEFFALFAPSRSLVQTAICFETKGIPCCNQATQRRCFRRLGPRAGTGVSNEVDPRYWSSSRPIARPAV